MSIEKIEQAIVGYWGERCTDFDAGCPCCLAWREYDRLREVERSAKEVLHPFYMADKRLGWSHLNAHVSDDDDIPVKAGDVRRASDLFRALSEREGQE